MHLPKPFIQLPIIIDADRLAAEVDALDSACWDAHPNSFEGNSCLRLISVNGLQNDEVSGGPMQPTKELMACHYIRQVLAAFGVVWSRSRLMRLAPGAVVPEHVDVNYHWFNRVRVHIPIRTTPDVLFHCGDETVHMRAGEAWIFDNWRRHSVENKSDQVRIHLVADTTGSAGFWNLARQGLDQVHELAYDAAQQPRLLCEREQSWGVMPPAEFELITTSLAQGLDVSASTPSAESFQALLRDAVFEWRQLWLLYGDAPNAVDAFDAFRKELAELADALPGDLRVSINGEDARRVLRQQILQPAVQLEQIRSKPNSGSVSHPIRSAQRSSVASRFQRPVFIVAAPRSGSSLLFETLACTPQLLSFGGESHAWIEGVEACVPGAPGVSSNRLTAEQCTKEIGEHLTQVALQNLHDHQGSAASPAGPFRFLEKTPKNALRIPFLRQMFPDACFIHLWRTPQQNISSIMEAWKSGRFVTYRDLPNWMGNWSLLLPPGWQNLSDEPLESIAAYQWAETNRIIMEDVAGVDDAHIRRLSYEALLENPQREIESLCEFIGIDFDSHLAQRVGAELPLSKHTHTRPQQDKWHINRDAISRVESLWRPVAEQMLNT